MEIINCEKSKFKQLDLRHNRQAFHPFIDCCLVPANYVPLCKHYFVEPDTRTGNASTPQESG
jgi:hypothetical protein